jgi:O-antigen/teichoic acid export membrane protein
VTISLVVPVLVGWWALRPLRAPMLSGHGEAARSLLRETVHNSQALLAFFVLANIDVILARNILSEHEAGLYAAGVILSKAVLFLPQFVIVVAFPSMAGDGGRGRALWSSLLVVGGIGVLAMLASVLLSGVAMIFVGGDAYREVQSDLWVFALLGTLMAMLQLLVYSVLARQGRRAVWLMWTAVAAVLLAGLSVVHTRADLLLTFIVVDAVLLVALIASTRYHLARVAAPR